MAFQNWVFYILQDGKREPVLKLFHPWRVLSVQETTFLFFQSLKLLLKRPINLKIF